MKYIAYARKSTESDDRQVLSIESQFNEVKRLVERDGIILDEVFSENKSAKAPGRPEFQKMLKFIQKNKCTIYAWKLDRLARNPKDGGELLWQMDEGQLYEIRTFDRSYSNKADEKFMMNLEFGMAKKYVDDLSVNVRRGFRAKLERGEWPYMPPFGYSFDPASHLVVLNSQQGQFITEMFRLYASGSYGIRELSQIMYEKGLRNKRGTQLGKTRIHCILSNPFYYGMMVKDGVHYPGKHEVLITKEIFDQVQEVIGGRYKARPKKQFFTHRGFMNCHVCGCALTATLKKGHAYYYCTNGKNICDQHKKYLRSEVVDGMMGDILGQVQFDEEMVEIMYLAAKEKIGLNEEYAFSAIQNLKKQLDLTLRKQERLVNSYLDGSTPETVYKPLVQSLGNEIVATRQQIKKMEEKQTGETNTLELTKEYFLTASRAKKEFLSKDDVGKRTIVEKLLWNLTIENKILATYKLKEPFQYMVGAPQFRDISAWRVGRDSNPQLLP